MVEKAPKFFFVFFGSRSFYFLRLSHLKPILIKMAHSLPNFHQFLSHFIPPKFFIYFWSLFSAFFYLFFFLVRLKIRGVKKRGKSSRNVTKIFFLLFWVPFVIIVILKSPGTHLEQNGKRFFDTRQKWQKIHFYHWVLLVRFFQKKKKAFFKTKFWMFIFFFLLGSKSSY